MAEASGLLGKLIAEDSSLHILFGVYLCCTFLLVFGVHRICFIALGASMNTRLCIEVNIIRCQLCAQAQESMHSLSITWHTSWTELWSGNHNFSDPDLIQASDAVNLRFLIIG